MVHVETKQIPNMNVCKDTQVSKSYVYQETKGCETAKPKANHHQTIRATLRPIVFYFYFLNL